MGDELGNHFLNESVSCAFLYFLCVQPKCDESKCIEESPQMAHRAADWL